MSIYSQLKNLLLESGLSEIDTIVYIELLKSPALNKWDIVNRTHLSKSAVYRAFEKLESLKLIKNENGFIRACSLKTLVSEIKTSERNLRKLAYKIKSIAPFLKIPSEYISEFEQFYTKDQISQAYLYMSEIDYDVNLDFGDFENCVDMFGGLKVAYKFRNNRAKRASNHAICTSFGPKTSVFCTKDSEKKFKNKVDMLDIDFKKKFIIFSDRSDCVLFNDFSDEEYPVSVLVKSKPIANIQRLQFDNFSRTIGNF